MQFKNIVAFVSLAVMATALPAAELEERTSTYPVDQQCPASTTVKCCNSFTKALVNLKLIDIGLFCTLPVISGQCVGSTKAACCKTGSQTGLVNVGSVCPQIL